jgi:hypothetical protein
MPACCLWCLKPAPDARKGDEHLCDGTCRQAFHEATAVWLDHAVQIMGQEPEFDLGGLEEGRHG